MKIIIAIGCRDIKQTNLLLSLFHQLKQLAVDALLHSYCTKLKNSNIQIFICMLIKLFKIMNTRHLNI